MFSSSHTCEASSRVGTSTRPRGRLGAALPTPLTSGTPKAMVLPDPVGARPQMSRPARASGMVAAWIGKGASMPRAARLDAMEVGTPRSANVEDTDAFLFCPRRCGIVLRHTRADAVGGSDRPAGV